MRIIRAVLAGERDALKLAQMKDHRIKSSVERIAKALEGDYRAEHIFALKQAVELYDTYRQKIEACDAEIDTCLARIDSKIDLDYATGTKVPKTKKRANRNQPTFDLRSHLYRITGVDFTAIDGFDVLLAHTVITEVGLDPSHFPTSGIGSCMRLRNSSLTSLSLALRRLPEVFRLITNLPLRFLPQM